MIPSHAKTIWGDTLPYTEPNRSQADVVKGIKYNPINYNESKYIDGTGKKKWTGIQQYDGAVTEEESEDESDFDPIIVKLAKRNAKRHNINVIHGRPNDASGNCAFEAVIYNIQDRREFSPEQKINLSILESRRLWITELQSVIESDHPEIPQDLESQWNKLRGWSL